MKIKSIELYNIGLYKKDKIIFDTSDNSATIIWGNNGAGKTTLLNSIKLVLFGASAFKLEYDDYFKFIRDNVISTRKDKKNIKASITSEIELIENYENISYLIKREWKVKENSFDETVVVYRDDRLLSYEETEEFLNKLKLTIPPTLLDVIIFDGENAIDVLKNNEMPKLIKNIVNAVFGMDVYNNLIKDLSLYLKNMSLNKTNSTEDNLYLMELESCYKKEYTKSNLLNNSLKDLNDKKNSLFLQLNLLSKKLSDKTGVKFDELKEFKESLSNIEEDKKTLNSELKFIQEEILPMKLLHKKIKAICAQINKEKPYLVLNNFNMIKSFFENDAESIEMINKLIEKMDLNGNQNILLNLNEKDSKKIELLDSTLDIYNKEKLLSYYSEKNETYEILKDKLSKAEMLNDETCISIVENIRNIYDEVFLIEDKLHDLRNQKNDNDTKLLEAKTKYESYKKELLANKKSSNSYLMVLAYKECLEQFVDLTIKNICDKLNSELLKNLHSIKFRNNSIDNVQISTKTFEIKLYEKDNKLIPSNLFSAGEKQILLGLLIKSALYLSKIDTFFLFDTPVGRLDVNNRSIFTKEVIFKVADQVIIFATDSDYTKNDYDSIKDNLSQELCLRRNKNDEIVIKNESIYKGTLL